MLSRRQFNLVSAAFALTSVQAMLGANKSEVFVTRGVVLYPWDLNLNDWPERAAKAGITTIGLHAAQRVNVLVDFVNSERGADFLARCQKLGVQVEYELHAMGELLSRELFYQDTEMFRADASGRRKIDSNCCPSSSEALNIIAGKAVELARILKPTTGRYFYWPDDGRDWCHCPKCKGFTASDQATLVENAIIGALRKHVDPQALLSHIAYQHTLEPPKQIRPHEGLFVEFAPFRRLYNHSIGECEVATKASAPDPATHGGYLDLLDANLAVFGKESAQILEYWLDVSRFSVWSRPAKKLPWNAQVLTSDAKVYAQRGVRHVTSFATWIDDRYVRAHGAPPLEEYGRILREVTL